MRDRFKATIENRTRPRGLPCERFQPNEPERDWLGTFGLLNRSLAFWLKNSPYFSCCLQGGLICYLQQLHVMHPALKKRRSGKADGFGETNPTVTQIESMQTWPNEPKQSWRRASALAGRALSRDSAPMVHCDCRRVANDFRHFSANEANLRKRSQHRKGKRNDDPR